MTTAVSASAPYPQSPVIEKTNALLCLIINIILPGIGTIVAGVMGNKPLIGRGIAQLLLAFIFVGWIWAIVSGVQFVQNATWMESQAGIAPRAA